MNLENHVDHILRGYSEEALNLFEDRVRQTLKMVKIEAYAEGLERGVGLAQGTVNTYSGALEESNNTVQKLTEDLDDLKRKMMFSGI